MLPMQAGTELPSISLSITWGRLAPLHGEGLGAVHGKSIFVCLLGKSGAAQGEACRRRPAARVCGSGGCRGGAGTLLGARWMPSSLPSQATRAPRSAVAFPPSAGPRPVSAGMVARVVSEVMPCGLTRRAAILMTVVSIEADRLTPEGTALR